MYTKIARTAATADKDGGMPMESKYRNLLGDQEGNQFFDHFTDFLFQDEDPYEKAKQQSTAQSSSSSSSASSSRVLPPPPPQVKKRIKLQVAIETKAPLPSLSSTLPPKVVAQITDETKPPVMIDRLWRIYQRVDLKKPWFQNQKEMILPKYERLVEMRLQIYSTISKFIASGKSLWMDTIDNWPEDPEFLDMVFFRSGKAMNDDRWSFWLTWHMFQDCVLKHCKTKDKAELALVNWMDLETKLLHIRMKHSSPIQSPHSLIRGLFQQMYLDDTVLERVDKNNPKIQKMLEYYEHCTCFERRIKCECTAQHKSWWSDKNWFIRSSNFDVVLGNKYFTGNNNPRLKMWPTGTPGEWYLPLIVVKDIILKEQQKVWNKMMDQAKYDYQKGELGNLDKMKQLEHVVQKIQSGFYVFGHQLPNPNDRFGLYKKANLPEGVLPWVFMNKIAPRCIRQLWSHPDFHVDHNARTLIGFFCRKFGVSIDTITRLLQPKMQSWWIKHKNYSFDKCNTEWKAVSSSIDHALHRAKHPVMYGCFTLQNESSSDGKLLRCPFIANHTRDGYTECKRQCQTSTLRDIEDLYAQKMRMPLARPKLSFTPNTNLSNPIDVTLHMIQYVNDIGLDLDKLF